jgi:DNA repair exonuclease SbcCD ATPase subunit
MTIDNKIIASIGGVIMASIIGQLLYTIRSNKKKIEEQNEHQYDKIYAEVSKLATGLQDTRESLRDINKDMIKGFGDVKNYMLEHFAKREDLNQIAKENREEHGNIYKKINGV